MEGLIFFVVVGGGALAFNLYCIHDRLRSWRAAAEVCGLTDVAGSGFILLGSQLTGRSESLRVRFDQYMRDKKDRGTKVTVTGPGDFGLALKRESFGTAVDKRLFGAREIEIGDEVFDETFYIGGAPMRARALLDAETRPLLYRINGLGRLEIAGGELRLEIRESLGRDLWHSLSDGLGLLLDAARRLTREIDVASVLAENARADPLPSVRLQNLLVLIRELGWRPETKAALRAASDDPSPEIRLRAAAVLGQEGVPVLMRLTEGDDVWAAQAVAMLGRQLTLEQTNEILDRSLRSRRLETAGACVAALGRIGGPAVVAPLAKVMAIEQDELAVGAAHALGAAGAAEAEPALLEALQCNDAGLRLAAAEALRAVGSVAAVLPLKEAAEGVWDRDFARAARQAIAAIQSRLPGATPGQLSLAAAEAGQVSLSEHDAGRLSFPAGEAGQVSLPHEQPSPEDAGQQSGRKPGRDQ